jgi:hypothetical protein
VKKDTHIFVTLPALLGVNSCLLPAAVVDNLVNATFDARL